MMPPRRFLFAAFAWATILGGGTSAHATTKGLNQIVTPDIQPTGVLSISAQAQHSGIGNSQEVQLELGLTPQAEISYFHGFDPREEIFGSEFNVWQRGPHLVSVGAVNWSSRGGGAQPFAEYGFYSGPDHVIVGAAYASRRAQAIVGYSRQLTDSWQISADYQSGDSNSATLGFTVNLRPDLQMNPAIYFTNASPHHVLGYVVLSWNLPIWK
jgi:hypothetical protein